RNHGQREPGRFEAVAGNLRLSEMAAAIGLAQLERLDAILERRRALAERYLAALDARFGVQRAPDGARSNWQTFGVVLPPSCSARERDALVAALRERGVESGRLSYALSRVGSLSGKTGGGPVPVAEAIDERGIALPLHPLLDDAAAERVLEAFRACAEEVVR
ncbi:MAG TPA: DegT/DnrJ/EryC1/StrS family aminotransferase, partial [Sandaracinaceae bacterium]